MDIDGEVAAIGARARTAARILGPLSTPRKNAALHAIARGIRASANDVLDANARDVRDANARAVGAAMVDRLTLDEARLALVTEAVLAVAALPDPVGTIIEESVRPSGIRVARVRAPLGVVAMVYESRPNVTAEASALTLKTGNAIVLRGGSEAHATNMALAGVIARALGDVGLPPDAVQVLPFTDRDAVRALVQCSAIDLAIPRGGEALIRFVTANARVPVVQHYKGVCHLFVDAGADVAMATSLVMNGKLQRPSACNALECLLVDASDAARLLPPIAAALLDAGCEIRGDARARQWIPAAKVAGEDDWGREYLDRILAVRVVDGLAGALLHVAQFGSGHTEAICTSDARNADRWRREVDAACVIVNASTRFHDGGELGLGAEIGIATSRLHWRGPMGLESLTTMKWVVDGDGQARR